MIESPPLLRMRGIRAIVAMLVVLLLVAGCAEGSTTVDDNQSDSGTRVESASTDSTTSAIPGTGNTTEETRSNPSDQASLAATTTDSGSDATTSTATTSPKNSNTTAPTPTTAESSSAPSNEQSAGFSETIADESGDAEYTYSEQTITGESRGNNGDAARTSSSVGDERSAESDDDDEGNGDDDGDDGDDDDEDGDDDDDEDRGVNHVEVINKKDGKLRLKASLQLNRITGSRVEPSNLAVAYASCTDCQTIAIALQINLVNRNPSYIAPENYAVAVNYECTNCYTVARAIQYTIGVDDPNHVPEDVEDLLEELDEELRSIQKEKGLSIEEIDQRINAVIEQFRALAESLRESRDESLDDTTPGATPVPDDGTPTPDGSPTPTTSSTPASVTPSPSASPTAVPTEPSGTPSPAATATP